MTVEAKLEQAFIAYMNLARAKLRLELFPGLKLS